tara:strand:+ start:85 stop:417 length:333 start_codon:yes stop_codon:yes gene_type:complete
MVNNLGVDPNEWFDNPLDRMPIAKDTPSWEDTAPSEYEPPHEEMPAELKETPTSIENPDFSDEIEKEKTMHQKMYEIATARYNPFSLGGSENCDSDISCNLGGGSERIQN